MAAVPTVDSLVDDVIQLVSLPDIYYKLEEAIEDPNMSLGRIAGLIGADPDLTLRIMGIANSCFFGFPAKVETLDRAVTLIGTRQLRDIVLVTVVVKKLSHLKAELIDMSQFWRHSVSTGVIARTLATYRRKKNIERYYALGLLHDIGKVLLCLKSPSLMAEVIQLAEDQSINQHMAEREILGFDHAQVGGKLLESWLLADSMYRVVSTHHNPMNAGEWSEDAAFVHVADLIAHALNWDNSGQPLVPKLSASAWDCIEIPESVLPDLVERSRDQYADAINLLLS